MATEDIMGSVADGTVCDDDSLSLAQLTELCKEIDKSWTDEDVKKIASECLCTDRGFIKIRMEPDWVHIDLIGVLKEHRGKDEGRRLVKIAEDVAYDLGLCGVGVATIEPGFFSRLGFETLNTYSGALNGEDLVVMFKEIQENVFDSKKVIA